MIRLIVHDLFVGNIMMGPVYPGPNEHRGCIDWKSDSDMTLEIVSKVCASIEMQDKKE